MHLRTVQFTSLLSSYPALQERHAVAIEFAELFIEEENVVEVLAALSGVSPETNAAFIGRVNEAPRSEAAWAQFSIVGANLSRQEAERAKSRWRECVSHVRKVIHSSASNGA